MVLLSLELDADRVILESLVWRYLPFLLEQLPYRLLSRVATYSLP